MSISRVTWDTNDSLAAVVYTVDVRTGDAQVEALDSPAYIQIFGSTTATPKLFLEGKTNSFAKESTDRFTLTSNNVGEVRVH